MIGENDIRRKLETEESEEPDELPAVLAHYTDLNSLSGILRSGEIFATHFRHLKDTSELTHLFAAFSKLAGRWLADSEIHERDRQVIRLVQNALLAYRDEAVFVSSFTGDDDDLDLWKRYCRQGGVSLAFEPALINRAIEEQGFRLRVCCYGPQEHEELVCHNFWVQSHFWDRVPGTLPAIKKAGFILADFLQVGPLLKRGSFRTEREWRLISPRFEADPEVRFRGNKSKPIPYLGVSITRDGRLPLRRIVVGPFGDCAAIAREVEQILDANGYGDVDIVPSGIPIRQ